MCGLNNLGNLDKNCNNWVDTQTVFATQCSGNTLFHFIPTWGILQMQCKWHPFH